MTHRINIKHPRGDNSKKPMSLPDLSTLGLDIGVKPGKKTPPTKKTPNALQSAVVKPGKAVPRALDEEALREALDLAAANLHDHIITLMILLEKQQQDRRTHEEADLRDDDRESDAQYQKLFDVLNRLRYEEPGKGILSQTPHQWLVAKIQKEHPMMYTTLHNIDPHGTLKGYATGRYFQAPPDRYW